MARDPDSTPVQELSISEQEHLRLIRDAAAARADWEMAKLQLDEAHRELDQLRGRNQRLEGRNDFLLQNEAGFEARIDELKGENDRLRVEVLHLKQRLKPL